MESRAVAKYMRISPQKVRKLAFTVKGKRVGDGIDILKFMPQKATKMVLKVINSAVANASLKDENVDVDDLFIKNIYVDQGPTLKRFRARARGRGTRILKRTSHITVVLSEDSV
jgi:large subunit ribosomal protein L22